MDEKLFKATGRFSKAWYIRTIKENPDRRGYSWIRKEQSGAPQFEVLKSAIQVLVNQRYIDPVGKPDGKGSTPYKVTSLGHRFLEENKSELELAQERIAKAEAGIIEEASKKLEDAPGTLAYRMKQGDPLLGKKYEVGESNSPAFTHEDIIENKKDKNSGFVMQNKSGEEIARSSAASPENDQSDVEDEIRAGPGGYKKFSDLKVPDKPFNEASDAYVEELSAMDKLLSANQKEPKNYFDRSAGDAIRKLIGEAMIAKFGDQMTVKELLEYAQNDEENW